MYWCNVWSHGVLDLNVVWSLNMAFVSRLWPEVWLGIASRQFGW